MIGWLRGEVLRVSTSAIVTLSVRDVGYELSVPLRAASALVVGESSDFFVHTHVRDDAIVLYGFSTPLERETFELLLGTPGVGPSTALGALSTFTPQQLASAISNEDVTLISSVPGIGKKTASRLVLELNGKLPSLDEGSMSATADVRDDLNGALRQLGYTNAEIKEALRDVELPDDDEGALRLALRQLGRQ
jgi:Holliday junction DNA helicase RuvA